MRLRYFLVLILLVTAGAGAEEFLTLKVRDEVTTYPSATTLILDNGRMYWGEAALGSLFGATAKPEGENLIILCREEMCLPFYKDDPQNPVIESKGKSLLPADLVVEAFGYKRIELDKNAGEIRLFKTAEKKPEKPGPIPFPPLCLRDMQGQCVPLDRFKGEKLIILVWAPWEKGRDTLAAWNRLATEAGETCSLVLIAQTIEGPEKIEPFQSILTPRPTCLVDAGFRMTRIFSIAELPSLLLVDEKGSLVEGPEKADPKDPELKSRILAWVGEDSEKVEMKGPAISQLPPVASIEEGARRLELAEILWAKGKKIEAIREIRAAMEQDPDHAVFKGQLEALASPDEISLETVPEEKKPGP